MGKDGAQRVRGASCGSERGRVHGSEGGTAHPEAKSIDAVRVIVDDNGDCRCFDYLRLCRCLCRLCPCGRLHEATLRVFLRVQESWWRGCKDNSGRVRGKSEGENSTVLAKGVRVGIAGCVFYRLQGVRVEGALRDTNSSRVLV